MSVFRIAKRYTSAPTSLSSGVPMPNKVSCGTLAAATLTTVLVGLPASAAQASGCWDPLADNTSQPALQAYKGVDSPSGGLRMESDVTISRISPGTVSAVTHIWSTTKLRGYHGAVMVVMRDNCNNIIGVTVPQRYGVDGKLIGQHDRREYWAQDVGTEITTRTRSVQVLHQRKSDSQITSYNRYRDTACRAIAPVKPICPLPRL